MRVNERQEKILNTLIQEYIKSAQPVSSQLLEKKYNFGICPATIRIEMQKLTDAGFIFQPHTSAGRVPTDKGYRFFVDSLLEREIFDEAIELEIGKEIGKEMEDTVKTLQCLTKSLASFSSNLALGYLFNEDILWDEGWEEIVKEPEFKETKMISNLAEVIKSFGKEIGDARSISGVKVYIGRENPFPGAREFSTIMTRCRFPKDEGILAILGPKRMSYEKNISSLNSLVRILEKL